MADVRKTINHAYQVITGVNELIDRKALRIDGTTVYLFPELYHSNPEKLKTWMKNLYMYCRLKLKYKEGTPIYCLFRSV